MIEMLQSIARSRARRARAARPLASAAALVACLLALPAWAATLKDVRVGQHPDFTRIVFEFDEQAGYRIKRSGAELVVTLDAASKAWKLGKRGAVAALQLDASRDESVARIRLTKSDLRLQEMILANPPRVVLDLFGEEPVARSSAAPPRTAPKKPVARATPAPQATAKAEPATPPPPAPAKPPAPEPKPEAASAPMPTPAPPRAEAPEAAAAPAAPLIARPAPRPAAPAPEAAAAAPEAAASPEPERAAPVPSFVKVAPPSEAPVARRPAAAPRAPAKSAASQAAHSLLGLLDNMMVRIAGAALGVIVVVVGIAVVLRRRRAIPNDLDVAAISDEALPAAAKPTPGGAAVTDDSDDELFGDLDSAISETRTDPAPAAAGAGSIFDDDDPMDVATNQQGDAAMDQNLSTKSAGSGAAAGDGDIARIVRELQSRVNALESKLEEASEARERLERQVAAQSEELRVQRAAIARTQRALRSMSRPDDDKATEPALRDADTQMKTRVNG
jgi:hypothetical protein